MPGLPADEVLWPLIRGVLERTGLQWQQLLLAWARVLPLVLIVPAFGSRLMPAPARAVFGLGLALLLVPAVAPTTAPSGLWVLAFVGELVRGLPIALSSAAMIWAAMMAGGLVDDLRGASQQQSGVLPDAKTPLSTFLGLFSILAFLQLGGVSSAVAALTGSAEPRLLLRAVADLVQAINIAFALTAPLLCVSVVWEVVGALVARAASPAHVQALLAPLRSIVLLGGLAVVLPRLFELMVEVVATNVR